MSTKLRAMCIKIDVNQIWKCREKITVNFVFKNKYTACFHKNYKCFKLNQNSKLMQRQQTIYTKY